MNRDAHKVEDDDSDRTDIDGVYSASHDLASELVAGFVNFVATLPPEGNYGREPSLAGLYIAWAHAEGDNNGFDACGGNRDLYGRVFLNAISMFEICRPDFGVVGEKVQRIMSLIGERTELVAADQWSLLAFDRMRTRPCCTRNQAVDRKDVAVADAEPHYRSVNDI